MKFRNLGEHGNNFERNVLLFWVLVKNVFCNLDQNGLVKNYLFSKAMLWSMFMRGENEYDVQWYVCAVRS